MRLVGGPAVAAFVAARGGAEFGDAQTIGFIDDAGLLVCGFVYHDWQPERGTIEISAAATSPRWATRGNIETAFGYPFDEAGCQLAYAWTDETNRAVRRGMKWLGATEHVIPRLRGPDRAGVLLTLTAEAWANWKGRR